MCSAKRPKTQNKWQKQQGGCARNTLSQRGRLWDLHAIHLSNCIRANSDCCGIGTANFPEKQSFPTEVSVVVSRRVVCKRTTAAVRSNNNKVTTTATAKKHPPTEDSRWAITRSTCSTPCFMCRLVQLRELDESAAQFAHSPCTCVASVLSVYERASKQASA